MSLRTLDNADVAGKRVLLRADLNVPVHDGRIADLTRIERLTPTIRELLGKGAKVIVCSHFDRPKGKRVPTMSLAPIAVALGQMLGTQARFAEDCIGSVARHAVEQMAQGDVLVLENTRFYSGEEANDPAFAAELAKLADVYVNDAFSAAHRAHASTEGVAHLIPAYAGRLMQAEVEALDSALSHPLRPLAALVGGAKVSTKLDLLGNLVTKVNALAIGGAMANTFLSAQGTDVGGSLQEADMHASALAIIERAKAVGCELLLPTDVVVANELKRGVPARTVPITAVPADAMILDVGPATVAALTGHLPGWRTLVWNGPIGAFETPPFDAGTTALAAAVADATAKGTLRSVAGGGDTLSALRHAGAIDKLSYVSTAGGAFLEWLEGKALPGVVALGTPA